MAIRQENETHPKLATTAAAVAATRAVPTATNNGYNNDNRNTLGWLCFSRPRSLFHSNPTVTITMANSLPNGVLGCPLADLGDVSTGVSLGCPRQHFHAHIIRHRRLDYRGVTVADFGSRYGTAHDGSKASISSSTISKV